MNINTSQQNNNINIVIILILLLISEISCLYATSNFRILVIIPETLIMRPKVPDPAAETEIINKLVEEGYNVVDQQLIGDIRYSQYVLDAYNNDPNALSYLFDKYKIDLLILGEAFSEEIGMEEGIISFKARLEVKAILTNNRRIIASNSIEATGIDVSPSIAGKKALKNAGTKMADYLISKINKIIE